MRPIVVTPLLSLVTFASLGADLRAPAPAPRRAAPATASAAPAPIGMYRAVLLDRQPLPAVERFAATNGYFHWVKLDGAVVTLRPDGRFVASFRYWHHHLPNGSPIPPSPVLSDVYRGTYTVQGATVTLHPQVQQGKRPPQPIVATMAGQRMRVDYPFANGARTRVLRLDLERDAAW